MLANNPARVIAAEATFRGDINTRYADMKAIASVISNRALALGVTPQQVIGVNSQFNSYNKAMPPGTASLIDMAKQAIADVEQNGPVNNATYFATPTAAKNLPNGLEQVDAVSGGHVYYSDPNARAIKTSVGFRAPNLDAVNQAVAAAVPVPDERPAIETALADEAPQAASPFDAVLGQEFTPTNFDMGRFGGPTATGELGTTPGQDAGTRISSLIDNASPFERMGLPVSSFPDMAAAKPIDSPMDVNASLGAMVQPNLAASARIPMAAALFSPSVQPPTVDASATAMLGANPDLSTSTVATPTLSVPASADLGTNPALSAQAAAVPSQVTGEFGDINSAAQKAMDAKVEAALAGMQQNPASTVNNSFSALANAGPMAAPVSADPNASLGAAPDLSASATATPVDNQTAAQRMDIGPTGFDPSRFGDVVASNFDQSRFGSPTAVDQVMATPQSYMDAPAPTESALTADNLGISSPGYNNLVSQSFPDPNVSLSTPSVTSVSPVMSLAETQSVAKAPAVSAINAIASPTRSMSMAQSTPQHTAMDVWGGLATTGLATDGSTVSRLPDGTIGRYNPKYDQTEYTNPDGSYGGLKKGNLLGPADPNTSLSNPASSISNTAPSSSLNTAASRLSNSVLSGGTVGSIAGALLGSALAGPIGGIALGMLGQKLGGKYLGDQVPDESPMHALFGLLSGAVNRFPAAPTSTTASHTNGGYGSLNDYGKDVYGGSSQFSGAVDSGTGGLW
jgi:hypothetical protein